MDKCILHVSAFPVCCDWFPGNLLALGCKDGLASIEFMLSIRCIFTNPSCPAKNASVLSVACNPQTNTVVAGTELVSSQAVVAFWLVSSYTSVLF